MKKFLVATLILAMALNLCACSQEVSKMFGKPNSDVVNDVGDIGPEDQDKTKPILDPVDVPEDAGDTDDVWEPWTVHTGDAPGVKLTGSPVKVSGGVYDFSTPSHIDNEYGYTTFELPVTLEESDLSRQYEGLGKFDSQEDFLKAWTPYATGLITAIEKDGLLTDVELYGEESSGDHLFGVNQNSTHSYSLSAEPDGYQNVNYMFLMYIDTESESWDWYDYSELVDILNYYTGVRITTGDLYNMQAIVVDHLNSGAESWSVEVQSSERDNYDSFRVNGSKFTDNVQCWQFSVDRMISKWADLYDRDALRNGHIEGSING